MWRRMRALGLWGWVTLILVYIVVGAVVATPFGKNSLAGAIAGNVGGVVGIVVYLAYWRHRSRRHFAKTS